MSTTAEIPVSAEGWCNLSRLELLEMLQEGLVRAILDGEHERAAVIADGIRSIQLEVNEAFASALLNATAGIWQLH